jgi:hypothetical protein
MTEKQFEPFDLTARQDPTYAVHLPALSGFYIQQHQKVTANPGHYGPNRLDPTKFELGWEGMDFYNGTGRSDSYFNYQWGLYSAGHAKMDITAHMDVEPMVGTRREGTFMLKDSGGFQVAKGAGHFKNIDWSDFKGKSGDALRQKVLNWLEFNSDYSMTLDIPAFAAEPPASHRTGLKTFDDALDYSVLNLHYFMKHRTPGKTKFLNVLSSTNAETSEKWYEAVKGFSDPDQVEAMGYTRDRTLEGYAFAGINMKNMPAALARFADLIRDNLLADKSWIHFLGIGRLDWACYLTSLQRRIRKHHSPNLTISFDCASAFLATAKGQMYTHPSFTAKRFGYNMKRAIDDRSLKGSKTPMPFGGPIADRMTLGDMCRLGPGEPNKLGKVANTSWDNGSYLLAMASNVYTHVNAVQEACRLMDYELTKHTVHYNAWTKQSRSSSVNEVSHFVPVSVLFFDSFVEEFFAPEKTHAERIEMIEHNRPFLESISFGGVKNNVFGDLFDTGSESSFNNAEDIDSIASYEDNEDLESDDL